MEKIVIIGASDHALEAYNVLNDLNYKNNIYFYEENISRFEHPHGHSKIIDLKKVSGNIIAVQGVGTPHKEFILRVCKYVTKWMQVIHPTVHCCNDVIVGTGVVIKQKVILMPYVKLGKFVQINVGALIGHHVEVGDYSCIGPSANIMGRVTIGEECYIGVNSVILEKLKIADRVVIGAGAVVNRDISEAGTVWAGVPAKMIKK